MHVLVTGANGFVGSAVVRRLFKSSSTHVSGAVRSVSHTEENLIRYSSVGDIGRETVWTSALDKVDVVIHLAARAHVLSDSTTDPLREFRRVNLEGAVRLAEQAISSGVKRFVFISSIGVNGSITKGLAFTECSAPEPHAPYAQSKYEAEEALKEVISSSDMELVIIRPPLVFAANAPGNFLRLLKLVACGVPLPLGSVRNCRSMIALENLVDFIVTCTRHPAAANETFLISDNEDLSISEITRLLAKGMHKKNVLLPVPASLLRIGAKLIGKENLFTQLCCSLQIDSSKSRALLKWSAPVSAHTALVEAGESYQRANGKQRLPSS